MITTTYYKRDPKKETKKRKGTAVETTAALIGVPDGVLPVTENAAEALLDKEGLPVVACVVMRGDDDGTD